MLESLRTESNIFKDSKLSEMEQKTNSLRLDVHKLGNGGYLIASDAYDAKSNGKMKFGSETTRLSDCIFNIGDIADLVYNVSTDSPPSPMLNLYRLGGTYFLSNSDHVRIDTIQVPLLQQNVELTDTAKHYLNMRARKSI